MLRRLKLLDLEDMRPTEMARLARCKGIRVTYFLDQDDGNGHDLAREYVAVNGGQVYTGIHSDNGNWCRTRWYAKGWHIVNRTGDYAVVQDKRR